ncbi:hypothetical protein [Flavobacterium sp. HNIBRBA15423]|uniref:hypothetical protein n=1 Tax=Flavobacterium sp. HNIBRBA15423 TaxID=3458683 RepID=UPI004043EB60
MKNLIKLLILTFIISIFTNCEKEEVSTTIESNIIPSIISSKISFTELNNEIKTPQIKAILQGELFYTFNNDSFLRTSQSEPTFTKIQKNESLTTYSLYLNSYSQQKPYFLKLIITKNTNESEKIGFLKYIPTTPTTTLDIAHFSGEVQILDLNFEITATSEYINGVKQNNESKIENVARGRCRDIINIVEVKCSHSGEHGVGESCAPGYTNDAHFEIYVTTTCNDPSVPVQIIEDTGSASNGTGGVYPASIFLNPFLNTLTQEELVVYYSNPSIQEYLVNNLIVVPTPNYNPQLGGDPTMIIIEPQAQQFVDELMDLSIIGLKDIQISTHNPNNEHIIVNSLSDFKNEFINNQQNYGSFNETINLPSTNIDHIGTYGIKINFLYGLKINIKFDENPDGTYDVDENILNIQMTGLHPGITWETLDDLTTKEVLSNGNIKIVIFGNLNHTIYVPLPGTKDITFNQQIKITLIFNPQYGEIETSSWIFN